MIVAVHIEKRGLRLIKTHGNHFAENDVMGGHFLDFSHTAIERGKRIVENGCTGHELVEFARGKPLFIAEQSAT